MSSGYINLYFGNDAVPELAVFERLFEAIGLRLENPSTKQVLALSATGDQVLASREQIVSQLAANREVSVQWWYSGSEDVYCRFAQRSRNEQWRVDFGLDGVDGSLAETLIRAIVEFFKERCAQGDAAGLVVDRTGELEDVDWDSVIRGGEQLQNVPDILVLPRNISTPGFNAVREEISECPQHAVLKGRRARANALSE